MTQQIKSRSRTRRKSIRTPSGSNVTQHILKKPKKASCAICGVVLSGVACQVPNRLKKLSKSSRTVAREYGGVLCATCVVKIEKYTTRIEDGAEVRRDLVLEAFLPNGWFDSVTGKTGKTGKTKSSSSLIDELKAEEAQIREEVKKEKKESKPAKKETEKKATKAPAKKESTKKAKKD
jgi:large subunit ribosomal protein L34e